MLNPNIAKISEQISKMSMFVDQDPDGEKTIGIFSGILDYLYSDGSKDVQSFISLGEQTERILDWFFESHGIKVVDLDNIPFVLKKKIFDRFIELKRTKGSSATNYILMEMFVDIGMDIVSYRIIVDKPIGSDEPSFVFEPMDEKSKENIPLDEKEMFLVKHWDELSTYIADGVYPMRTNIIYHKVKQNQTDNKVPAWIYDLKMMSDATIDNMKIPMYVNGKTYDIGVMDIEVATVLMLNRDVQYISMIDTIDHDRLNMWYDIGIKLSETTGDVDMVKAREVISNIRESYTTKSVLLHDYISNKYPEFYNDLVTHDIGTIDTINMAKILKMYLADKSYGDHIVSLVLDKVIRGGEAEMYIRPLIDFFDEYFQIVYQETILDIETISVRIDDLFQKLQLGDQNQIETIVSKKDIVPMMVYGVVHMWYKLMSDSSIRMTSHTEYLITIENLKRIHGTHNVYLTDENTLKLSSDFLETVSVLDPFFTKMVVQPISVLYYNDFITNQVESIVVNQLIFNESSQIGTGVSHSDVSQNNDIWITNTRTNTSSDLQHHDNTRLYVLSESTDQLIFNESLQMEFLLSHWDRSVLGDSWLVATQTETWSQFRQSDFMTSVAITQINDKMIYDTTHRFDNIYRYSGVQIVIWEQSETNLAINMYSSNIQTDEVDAEIIPDED